jgi:1-aminocyclopropane-1-carboxylate deaminase/D-cysteine desulfhydrase-like pyridoxal-dependent ACC family enzyme
MMYGIFDLIRKDYFQRGTSIVALHTGGLQGWSGYPDMRKLVLD